jgi:hypothetical protein
MEERVYWTAEVADMVGIGTSTIRKYALALEAKGYNIQRNDKQQRAFTKKDVAALKRIVELTQAGVMTLDSAVNTVIAEFTEVDPSEEQKNGDIDDEKIYSANDVAAILEHVKKQDERLDRIERFNRELITRLDEQTNYITESINKRDDQITSAIRELQDTKRLIATSTEEKTEQPKGFLSKLFGKK